MYFEFGDDPRRGSVGANLSLRHLRVFTVVLMLLLGSGLVFIVRGVWETQAYAKPRGLIIRSVFACRSSPSEQSLLFSKLSINGHMAQRRSESRVRPHSSSQIASKMVINSLANGRRLSELSTS